MSFVVTRAALAFSGFADAAGGLLLLVAYYALADEITFFAELALGLQSLHAFTWFGYLLLSSGSPRPGFARMMLSANAAALALDVASVLLRTFAANGAGTLPLVSLCAMVGLLGADGFAWVFVRVYVRIRGDGREPSAGAPPLPVKAGKGEEEDEVADFASRAAVWLWPLELLLFAALATLYAAGLNRSAAYSRAILLEAPHAFAWLLHRLIAGSFFGNGGMLRDLGWIWLGFLASAALALAEAAALALRLYYVVSDSDDASSGFLGVPVVWGWVQLGIGAGLAAVSLSQAFCLWAVTTSFESVAKK